MQENAANSGSLDPFLRADYDAMNQQQRHDYSDR
jgi:hypothetical protein